MDRAVGFARQRSTRVGEDGESPLCRDRVEGYQTRGSCTDPSGQRGWTRPRSVNMDPIRNASTSHPIAQRRLLFRQNGRLSSNHVIEKCPDALSWNALCTESRLYNRSPKGHAGRQTLVAGQRARRLASQKHVNAPSQNTCLPRQTCFIRFVRINKGIGAISEMSADC
jgi:hypothetical protein